MRALVSLSGVGVRTKLLGGTLAAAGLSLAVYFGAGSAIDTVSAQDVVYFRIGREAVLRRMDWTDIGPEQAKAIAAIAVGNLDAILASRKGNKR